MSLSRLAARDHTTYAVQRGQAVNQEARLISQTEEKLTEGFILNLPPPPYPFTPLYNSRSDVLYMQSIQHNVRLHLTREREREDVLGL